MGWKLQEELSGNKKGDGRRDLQKDEKPNTMSPPFNKMGYKK